MEWTAATFSSMVPKEECSCHPSFRVDLTSEKVKSQHVKPKKIPVYMIYICSSVMCFPERRNSFFLCKKGAREICVRDAIEHLMKLSLQHTALVVCKRD